MKFENLTHSEMTSINGGGPALAIVGGLYGGIIGMSAVIFSGSTSGNDIWKGYVTGASAGAAIGLVLPTP